MEINKINPGSIQGIGDLRSSAKPTSAVNQVGKTFEQALDSLSQTQAKSDSLIQMLAAGEDVDIHTVMIASEQASINFRIAMSIRDKLVEAYREVMRMGV